jgi:hypothetical protein
VGAWPKIYRYKECPSCDACWTAFLLKQRERAGADLGYYDSAKSVPRLNVDQVIALVMMYERRFVAHDDWEKDTGDHLVVNLARVDPDTKRPTRALVDEIDDSEAWVLWSALGARVQVLDVFCNCDSGGRNFRGHCPPDTWTYAPTQTAQFYRVQRLALATQRRYQLVKPPPLLNPIGWLLGILPWALLVLLVAAEGDPRWRRN